MRRLFAVLAIAGSLLAAGCSIFQSTPSQTQVVHGFIDACSVYASTLETATVAANAGAFTDAQKAKIHSIRQPIEAICPPKGTMPSGVVDGMVTVVTGTAAIVAIVKGP